MKVLRIEAVVDVPDDAFELARVLSGFEPAIIALGNALGVDVSKKIVTPSGPRAKKAVAATPLHDTPGGHASSSGATHTRTKAS